MIPVNVVLLLWVWIGRIVFGVGGWFIVIFLFSVVPMVLLAMVVTTVLAFTQEGRPRAVTTVQAWAQLVTWLMLLLFGAFCPDGGDAPDSEGAMLTQVFGFSQRLLDLSYNLAIGFAVAAFASYLVLFFTLVFARRTAPAPA